MKVELRRVVTTGEPPTLHLLLVAESEVESVLIDEALGRACDADGKGPTVCGEARRAGFRHYVRLERAP